MLRIFNKSAISFQQPDAYLQYKITNKSRHSYSLSTIFNLGSSKIVFFDYLCNIIRLISENSWPWPYLTRIPHIPHHQSGTHAPFTVSTVLIIIFTLHTMPTHKSNEVITTHKHPNDTPQWFVMKVSRKEQQAADIMTKAGLRVFYPTIQSDMTMCGKKVIVERPLISNTLFVYSSFTAINTIKNLYCFITYSYAKDGNSYKILHVPDNEMERFIDAATKMKDDIQYFRPNEVNLNKGDRVRVIGGIFDGQEGILLKAKGRAKRMFLINFEMLGSLGTHISPEFIRIL